MEKGKKSNSFLYDLFMKYKEKSQSDEAPDKETAMPGQVAEEKQDSEQENVSGDGKEEAESPEVADENISALYSLYMFIYGDGAEQKDVISLSEFAKKVEESVIDCPCYHPYESEIKDFLRELGREASKREQLYRKEQSKYRRQKLRYDTAQREVEITERAVDSLRQSNVEESELDQAINRRTSAEEKLAHLEKPEIPSAVDASALLRITRDGIYAFLFLFPPYLEGKEIDHDDILKILKEKSVNYGVDEVRAERIAGRRWYMQLYQVAQGLPPVHGRDGEVIDKVSRNNEIAIKQGEDGKVDYKNLNLIQNVSAGDILCEIIEAEEGVPGMSVTGSVIQAENGKPAKIPNGKNTVLSENGTELLAAEDGCVKFKNGCFHVDQVYIVKGDVDYGEGNIDVSGDVVVEGDVLNGFCVKAKGNVTVRGMVEDAEIIAGGDIEIIKGMNGNRHGKLDAGGSVKAGFLENCTVYAGESIHTNSIISCDIFCEDTVNVDGARGVIIGGKITAYRSVTARIIGSKSNRETTIVLGEMPRLVTRRQETQDELKDSVSILEKLGKNIFYLEGFKASLPPEKMQILDQLKQQQVLYEERKCELLSTLERLSNTSLDFNECVVKANMIFPPTRIQIGSDSYVVTTVSSKCRVLKGDEGVTMGIL